MYLINITPKQIPKLEEFINTFSNQLNKFSGKKNLSAFKKRDYIAQALRYKSYSDLLNKSQEFALKSSNEDLLLELAKSRKLILALVAKYSAELGYEKEVVLECYSKTVTAMALRTAIKKAMPDIATEVENSDDPKVAAMTSLLTETSGAVSHIDRLASGVKMKPEILVAYSTDGLDEKSAIHKLIDSKEYKELKDHKGQGRDFFVFTVPNGSLVGNEIAHVDVRGDIPEEIDALVINLKNRIKILS